MYWYSHAAGQIWLCLPMQDRQMSSALVVMPEELEYEAWVAAGAADNSPTPEGLGKQRLVPLY
jgi:hypothetical protein